MSPALRELDDRWLPRAALRIHRLRAATRGWSRRSGIRHLARAARAEPALVGSIVAVVVAAVLLATIGEPAGSRDTGPGSPSSGLTAAVATVGPTPGSSVATYLTRASFDLRHFAEISHGRSTYAIVDLRRFVTPARAVAGLGGVAVVRAYVRVQVRGLPTLVRSFPLASAAGLVTGMGNIADIARATAKSYALSISALHPHTHADRVNKQRYVKIEQAAQREAAALAHPQTCACVFAFLVRGNFVGLVSLLRSPVVRVVDPAPPEVDLTGLTALPLDPTVTTVVPPTGFPINPGG